MADIFRKSVLDKLSSPEQLDRSIRIIPPSFWIAACGGGLIIVTALVWSIFGRLPVNVSANGMYMGKDGIHTVVAEAEGIVSDVYVSEGETVKKGQEIASLNDKNYTDEMDTLLERRESIEAVTFYSYDDEATPDNKSLIDIKSQTVVTGTGLTTDQELLRQKYKELSKARKATASAKSSQSKAKSAYKKAAAAYAKAETKYNEAVQNYNDTAEEYEEYTASEDPDPEVVKELEKKLSEAQSEVNSTKSSLVTKEAAMKTAETAYSSAVQRYNTNLSTQKSLKSTVSQLEAQVRADKKNKGSQDESLEMQFDSAKESLLSQIDSEIKAQQKKIDAMTLKSNADGRITGLNIASGNVVQAGSTICKVTSEEDDKDAVICYIPVTEGKKVKAGMEAVIYPSTVNRQEYGHMEAAVVSVSDYVVSQEDMLNQLGDSTLVQSFQQSSPVVRAVCELKKDESTVSGYYWSSKKGANIAVEEGTVVSADVVVEEKAPITMLIPLLKEKLSVKRDSEQNGQSSSN